MHLSEQKKLRIAVFVNRELEHYLEDAEGPKFLLYIDILVGLLLNTQISYKVKHMLLAALKLAVRNSTYDSLEKLARIVTENQDVYNEQLQEAVLLVYEIVAAKLDHRNMAYQFYGLTLKKYTELGLTLTKLFKAMIEEKVEYNQAHLYRLANRLEKWFDYYVAAFEGLMQSSARQAGQFMFTQLEGPRLNQIIDCILHLQCQAAGRTATKILAYPNSKLKLDITLNSVKNGALKLLVCMYGLIGVPTDKTLFNLLKLTKKAPLLVTELIQDLVILLDEKNLANFQDLDADSALGAAMRLLGELVKFIPLYQLFYDRNQELLVNIILPSLVYGDEAIYDSDMSLYYMDSQNIVSAGGVGQKEENDEIFGIKPSAAFLLDRIAVSIDGLARWTVEKCKNLISSWLEDSDPPQHMLAASITACTVLTFANIRRPSQISEMDRDILKILREVDTNYSKLGYIAQTKTTQLLCYNIELVVSTDKDLFQRLLNKICVPCAHLVFVFDLLREAWGVPELQLSTLDKMKELAVLTEVLHSNMILQQVSKNPLSTQPVVLDTVLEVLVVRLTKLFSKLNLEPLLTSHYSILGDLKILKNIVKNLSYFNSHPRSIKLVWPLFHILRDCSRFPALVYPVVSVADNLLHALRPENFQQMHFSDYLSHLIQNRIEIKVCGQSLGLCLVKGKNFFLDGSSRKSIKAVLEFLEQSFRTADEESLAISSTLLSTVLYYYPEKECQRVNTKAILGKLSVLLSRKLAVSGAISFSTLYLLLHQAMQGGSSIPPLPIALANCLNQTDFSTANHRSAIALLVASVLRVFTSQDSSINSRQLSEYICFVYRIIQEGSYETTPAPRLSRKTTKDPPQRQATLQKTQAIESRLRKTCGRISKILCDAQPNLNVYQLFKGLVNLAVNAGKLQEVCEQVSLISENRICERHLKELYQLKQTNTQEVRKILRVSRPKEI